MMFNFPEILFAKSKQGGTVEFRIAAHVVVGMRMKRIAILVLPHLFCLILAFDIHSSRGPVVFLTWYVVAAFQEQDTLAGGS
jgi:hypothetical protein